MTNNRSAFHSIIQPMQQFECQKMQFFDNCNVELTGHAANSSKKYIILVLRISQVHLCAMSMDNSTGGITNIDEKNGHKKLLT